MDKRLFTTMGREKSERLVSEWLNNAIEKACFDDRLKVDAWFHLTSKPKRKRAHGFVISMSVKFFHPDLVRPIEIDFQNDALFAEAISYKYAALGGGQGLVNRWAVCVSQITARFFTERVNDKLAGQLIAPFTSSPTISV